MWFNLLVDLIVVYILVECQELDIIGKNSMLYDPVNNLPYPCDSEKKPTKKTYLDASRRRSGLRLSYKLPSLNDRSAHLSKETKAVYKRADGDKLPIKLPPCPFPNGTQEHRWFKTRWKHVKYLTKLFAPIEKYNKRNDVIRKISSKEEAIRGQLYAGTDINTGYGGVGLSGASLGVLNMLSYVHAFDTKTGMPYVCDPFKKKPDEKIDNRWHMIVPPCPDFKKCLFPWKEVKDCETKVDNNPVTSSKRWFVEPMLFPVLLPIRQENG